MKMNEQIIANSLNHKEIHSYVHTYYFKIYVCILNFLDKKVVATVLICG